MTTDRERVADIFNGLLFTAREELELGVDKELCSEQYIELVTWLSKIFGAESVNEANFFVDATDNSFYLTHRLCGCVSYPKIHTAHT